MSTISKIKVGGTTYDIAYPVGSIYLSVNETSPAELFGGTWEQIKGKFLLGAGDTYNAGSTGGEATHTLTVDEMPNHTHSIKSASTDGSDDWVLKDHRGNQKIENINWQWGGTAISYAGGGQAHNNMPPYLAVYMWKRIA